MVKQVECLFRFKLPGGKACEVKDTPKAITSVREGKPDCSRPHSRIDSTEDYIQAGRDDVWQTNWTCL